MPESYLDTALSIIISSPAGSGKTEKLARRFISLLDSGTEVERILCITFTEKAAAEMKQRILSILERERPEMLDKTREKIPMMRISTIHAFCLKVLKRFSIELGLDPSLDVMDEQMAQELWTEAVNESMMADSSGEGPFFEAIKHRGLKGWQTIRRALDELHKQAPAPELSLGQSHEALGKMGAEAATILNLYADCLARYRKKKADKHFLDFNDLELLAHEALSLGPESYNILYSFDEHTDHLLVDEFQDTSSLQWMIIDKLTEEWRSGLGLKRSQGVKPTIFLVGDEKQSIYLFRGANVSVFRNAGEKLTNWMGDAYKFLEVKENYRSLAAITDFTNALFKHLMLADAPEPWQTRYSPFEHTREGQGAVELLLFDRGENTKDTRQKESAILAKRILELAGSHEIYDGDNMRPCRFEDMGILLSKRTHLGILESELQGAGVPFIVLKGIGFFEEPEVAVLRELVSFLTDPDDDYALFNLLRSPLFGLHYPELAPLMAHKASLMDTLSGSDTERYTQAAESLRRWLDMMTVLPLATLIEEVLVETKAWTHYSETQRHANIRKFLALLEAMEDDGLSILEIRERLIRQRNALNVSKANVNAEGMDAVRIMTIHAAKGLQFPMVFLPGMDERLSPNSGPVVFDEQESLTIMHYEEDSNERRKLEPFRMRKRKEEEEQKRLFYVAVTRSMDFLCMSGANPLSKQPPGRLSYLEDTFGIFGKGENTDLPFSIRHCQSAPLFDAVSAHPVVRSQGTGAPAAESFTSAIKHEPRTRWAGVTDDTEVIRKDHGRDWVITGTVLHVILEEISLGRLTSQDTLKRAQALLKGKLPHGQRMENILLAIGNSMEKLEESGILASVVLPQQGIAYTELPFVMELGGSVFSGRIDRVVIQDKVARVYDYKCFPVRPDEEQGLVRQYAHQMSRYSSAVKELFGLKVEAFLVLTNEGRMLRS